MSSPPVPPRLTPDWLAHRYDPAQDAVHFLEVDRGARRKSTFLTDQYLPQDARRFVMRREEALASASPAASVHFIFHSAFCCSTLLAAALDREGAATDLREPVILNDLVGWRRRGGPPQQVGAVLDGALSLLARPFLSGEAVIIKPSNVVNGFAVAMLGMRPSAKAIFLYAPLRVFLTSVAKKGLDGRLWVRELFLGLRRDGLVQRLGFDDEAFFGQTDLQIAAAGWLAQHALFSDLIAAPETAGRIRSLDSETLLTEPEKALIAAASLYGLRLTEEDIDQIVAGPFKRNPKSGQAFGRDERAEEYRAATEAHADEIEKVAIWGEAVADAAGIPLGPGAPLI